MAGIGLELNKLLTKRTYTSLFKAYAYAGLIGSGPWVVAVLSLGLLGTLLAPFSVGPDLEIFFISVSIIYAFTLVVTGPIQLVFTRYASDLEFTGKENEIFPAFVAGLGWQALFCGAVGLWFFVGHVNAPILFNMSAALLMVFVASIWLCGVLLSSLKHYRSIVIGFSSGFALSVSAAWIMARQLGIVGAMIGFTIGQAMLLTFLCGTIFRELGTSTVQPKGLLTAFGKYWDLMIGGFFYNLGIWIDKFFFWWADPSSKQVAGILYASPVFDRVVYFSFLTIIPGMTVFLLKLETEFAQKNQQFFQHVLRKANLSQLIELRNEMIETLRSGFALMLKVQGLCTALLVLSADQVLKVLNFGAVQAGVFQIALIGVFLLVILMAMLTVLYYLDKRQDAMWCTIIFATLNGAITLATIAGGERWFGLGFMVACGVSLVIASARVNHHLDNLIRDTFTSQPLYG